MKQIDIRPADFPDDTQILRQLFREYADWLAVDLGFQDFEAELAALPGKYAPPMGIALLAEHADNPALGCVAMRPLDDETCEMKRLYLRPEARGTGLGRKLAARVIEAARQAGYRRMVLDTLDHMQDALHLYDRLGFQPIAPYYHNPIPGAVYLGLDLPPSHEPHRTR